uniref:Aminotransferase class I/classII large domain-containing protein n=1 Tax=Phaeomonas parva TaxID=124430 RepID=A0A7S1XR07_9STRA|mmetsp:Transcript_29248/g.93708  ORF Transcript_29248/g.93708 Transcript_29248/m.93708 type:complete len:398 (+) Transcript_29248:161-1354(+)
MSAAEPSPSRRIAATDEPCIVAMQRVLASAAPPADKAPMLSLAQGIVYWGPPAEALGDAAAAVSQSVTSAYGADDGAPELRQKIQGKLEAENGLSGVQVMLTSGANQAFMNVVMALVDPGDKVGVVPPFYFNHVMALQMNAAEIVHLEPDPETLLPAVTAESLAGLKMLVLCNPNNPSGVVMSKQHLEEIAAACAAAGTWLVVDNTYEYFVYGDAVHTCVGGPHVVNVFSFSKAYGMMGWRLGYLAYPAALEGALMKVQDTIPICPPIISQTLALKAMDFGRDWVRTHFDVVEANRDTVRGALEAALEGTDGQVFGGDGAIYLFARLPSALPDDGAVVERLAKEHGVVTIPGGACGAPGHFRVAFANLDADTCRRAAARLTEGLRTLLAEATAAAQA